MHLDKLEIKGFKSFKDKTVLEFPDQYTAIVGPNGSGKSNIIDSICFVLGRSRGLRVTNITELICNGGPGGKECSEAKVSLYLSGKDKKQKVSREIDRTGKSVYRIDDKVATRQEIVDILGDNEYNIILQSDINKVIDMKPRERRKIIDDLCGIAEYDSKKEKALGELEKVEGRIAEVNIILGEKQGYLGELGREKDEAIRFQGLQDESRKAHATILHLDIEEHDKKANKISEKITEISDKKQRYSDRVAQIKVEVTEKNERLKGINSEILKLEEEKGATRIVELKGEINRNKDRLQNYEESLKVQSNTLSEKKKKQHAICEEEKKLAAGIKKIAEELVPLAEKIKEESAKVEGFEADKEIDPLKTSIFDLRSKIVMGGEMIERDNAEIQSLENERTGVDEKIKESLKAEKELAKTIDDHMMRNRGNFQEYESLRSELPQISKKYSEISKELEEAQMLYAAKKSEIATLERTTDNLSKSVAAVMQLKSIIPGIYGIVSQLGSISNPEFTKALQIAGGGRLEDIVVENEEVAGKCIEYLKKQRIGRATFLPLTKIKVEVMDDERVPARSLGFARTFITTPKKFEKIFDYVYRDTLLVSDFESAKKVGIGHWRMITVDGELITREGAITGGYTKDSSVSIRFSSTEELDKELKTLEKRMIKLDGDRQELDLKKDKVEEKIAKLEGSVTAGKTDQEKIKLEKEAMALRREELRARMNELDAHVEDLKKKLSENNEATKRYRLEQESSEKRLEKLLKKAPKVDTTLLDSMKEKKHQLEIDTNRLEEKKNLLALSVKELSTEIEALLLDEKSTHEALTKTHIILKELEASYSAQEKENARLMEDIERLIDQRSECEEEITKISGEAGQREYELIRIAEDISRNEVERAKIETKRAELIKVYETYAGVVLIEEKKLRELEELAADIDKQLSSFGSVNMRAIESYDTLKKEIDDVSERLETLKTERQSIFDFMETVELKKRETFMTAFEVIKGNFEKIYKEISGGEGTLILDNPREISECGLLIAASPKGKKMMNLDLMSGGEKVLTTSAFLLSIQRYKPSHFYIVDELDAALDRENSMKLAEMLSKTSAQFLLITHNEALMKYAQSVIGVSMSNGVSQIVGVKLTDNGVKAEKPAA